MRSLTEEDLAQQETQLARDGYTILKRLLDEDEADRIAAALQPLQDETPRGDNEFSGFHTRRVFNLLAKTRALDGLLVHPDVVRLARSALGPGIQLSIASTMEMFPGETAQALHQDDAYFRLQRPHPAVVLNTMWALTPFTERNGATRIVPGSQMLDRKVDAAEPSIAAAMPKGSVLLWDGAVWHGGGANASDEVRFGLSINYCRGWVRQQENQYLAVPRPLAKSLPPALQKMIGYDNCEFLGYVDRSHPLQALERA